MPAGASSGQDAWIPVNAGEATWANSGGGGDGGASAPMMGGQQYGATIAQPKETVRNESYRICTSLLYTFSLLFLILVPGHWASSGQQQRIWN